MYNCPLCKKEFPGFKNLHGHMLRSHPEEFREKKCLLSAWGIRFDPDLEEAGKPEKPLQGQIELRPLDLRDPAEHDAYQAGYRYIDSEENLYKSMREVKL